MAELEDFLGIPVIESYGMTEAAHQMASNPLPPKLRHPGCVGPAAGPEIAIMDEAGALLPPGMLGQVVIRGRNVTAGYENMPHKMLGEEVAAAVVLRPGQTATEHYLRDFAAAHLADFKVPRKVIFVDEIPKGATGKLQRAGLAQKLGIEA